MSQTNPDRRHSRARVVVEFLGSMNLAITLLSALAVASVIGTVLQQNLPYNDYLIKFGPFWFEVFERLGLYNVYAALWFIAVLTFLLISTGVCLWRHTPSMIREMRRYRENVEERSLRHLHSRMELTSPHGTTETTTAASELLQRHGYRVRRRDADGATTLASMAGRSNRLGYIFTHAAIIIICIGGLIDGNLNLKLKEWRGEVVVETRDMPASQVPAESRLPPGATASFRGNVTLPEGITADIVFLNVRDGYLVQELPFAIELVEFRIKYYDTGQPRSYESDVIIHDPELDEPFATTIRVNHPLIHRGYAFYQASFTDGGSDLRLRAVPLIGSGQEPLEFEAKVGDRVPLTTHEGRLHLEVTEFEPINVFPDDETTERRFINFGPSYTFRLRDAAGNAREYINYMLPVRQEARLFFLSGVRETPNEPFRYLHIPADRQHSLNRFLAFRDLLLDQERVTDLTVDFAARSLNEGTAPESIADVALTMRRLVNLFGTGGFDAVIGHINETIPEERRAELSTAFFRVLESTLQMLYLEVLREEGVDFSNGLEDHDAEFFEDAVNAIASLPAYGAPFFLQLLDFDHRQASGLMITRSPGTSTVYFGSVLLMIGIFLMFYVAHRRIWVRITPNGSGSTLLIAGSGSRHRHEFEKEFNRIAGLLQRRVAAPERV